MKITVIGVGYVGLVTAACLAELGNDIIGMDIDNKKISNLKKGIIPIYEPGLNTLVKSNIKKSRLSFTTDAKDAIQKSDVIFIAVGTPPQEDGSADLQYVLLTAEAIAKAANGYKIIVNKSTVPIGTGKMVENTIKQYYKGKFDVVSNPEFLREGTAINDFMHPDRIVIGHASPDVKKIMHKLYKPLNAPILFTNIETAEMIKYASNSMLATQVSFINSVANICERVGANVDDVAQGMQMDKRIGKKSFLYAGAGYGGSCFPKDVKALIQIARKHDYHFSILENVENVNKNQRQLIIDKTLKLLGSPQKKIAAIWGLAFKPNTDDMREAPSIDIIKGLHRMGVKIKAYDTVAEKQAKTYLPKIVYCKTPFEAAKNADVLVIITEWDEFKKIDFKMLHNIMRAPKIVDARNIYTPEKMKKTGFIYQSIGRS